MEPFDEGLPRTGEEVRDETGGRQTEGTAGAVPQESGLLVR